MVGVPPTEEKQSFCEALFKHSSESSACLLEAEIFQTESGMREGFSPFLQSCRQHGWAPQGDQEDWAAGTLISQAPRPLERDTPGQRFGDDLTQQGIVIFFFFFFFSVFLPFSRVTPAAHGGSQARGLIGVVAASLHQSHSNARSEPLLRPTPQLMAMPDPQPTEQGQGSNPKPHGS